VSITALDIVAFIATSTNISHLNAVANATSLEGPIRCTWACGLGPHYSYAMVALRGAGPKIASRIGRSYVERKIL
jgi:hypothetical protein